MTDQTIELFLNFINFFNFAAQSLMIVRKRM